MHPAPPTPGRQVSSFDDSEEYEIDLSAVVIEKKIGTGCTAEVYRGKFRDKAGQMQDVAIKVINWNKSNMGAQEQRAFDREVAIMPRISHENLVKFLGVSSKEKPFRIITEFCAGGCCFELLHNCDHIELVWQQKHKMANDIASAMDYLHKFTPQIIHRDLKSLNLLLVKPINDEHCIPHIKVSDFGHSRMKEHAAEADWGKLTIAAGTLHWMAPEVFSGCNYDEKVDVYSYGMILFEIICREIPFEDEEPAAVGRLAVNGVRPDLEAVPPDCPSLLLDIMMTCWRQDPAKRPTFDTIVIALEEVGLALARGGR